MSAVVDWEERKRQRREWYERRTATMREKYGVDAIAGNTANLHIRMIVSPWSVDEFGNRTRTIQAAE